MEYLGPKCNLKCSLELAFKILKYSQTNAIKDETITTSPKHYSIKLGTQWPVQATSQDEPKKKHSTPNQNVKLSTHYQSINQIKLQESAFRYTIVQAF